MNSIVFDSVDFSFGKTKILENVFFELKSNSLIGVVGPNGGGKTTLLNLLMGFLTPQSGLISIFGSAPKKALDLIGYVPQSSTLDPLFPITVKEVILLGDLRHQGRLSPSDPLNKRTDELLDLLGLSCKKNDNYFDLSGGQAQRVLIARALLKQPKVLILDEPTSNVDRENEKILFDILKELKKQTTILMVSHSLNTLTHEIDGALLVNKSVCYLKPDELCRHYSLGIFHPPVQIKRS